MDEALAVAGLLICVAAALRPPFKYADGVAAVAAAGILIGVGVVSFDDARRQVELLGPVVGFLAAVLVIADCCAADGLFAALGAQLLVRTPRSRHALLLVVGALAAVTTAALSLDTTVVLVTPVVVEVARAGRLPERPYAYLTGHLANSASLLLPVSNLTNLLAIAVVPMSFPRFAGLMVLPWLLVVGVEVVAVRGYFAGDFDESPTPPNAAPAVPWFATVVTVLTIAGFTACSLVGVAPAWAATAGALVLAGRRLLRRRASFAAVLGSTAPSFCIWVLAVSVVVLGVSAHGLAHLLRHVLPHSTGLGALLAVAALAAVVANLVNNLPATLLLVPLVAPIGVGAVLATLIGVNVGPNLAYPGSLATLLWRRVVADQVVGEPRLRDFTRLGAMTVPVALVVAVLGLWLALQVVGT